MYPCDKKTLDHLLSLIDKNDCKSALKAWSEYRSKVTKTCNDCPYEDHEHHSDCCMCLEGKLRTLSLYEHGADGFEEILLNAARKLDDYHGQLEHCA